MYNDIVSIGPVTIRMYGVMIAAGYLAALAMSLRRGKKYGLNEDMIWGIFFCAIVGGMAGTKILYYITILPQIIADPSLIWKELANGHVVYGGIIGGVLVSYLYVHNKKDAYGNREKFLPYFDLVMPSVSLAQGIGRIGCFFAGCCYGRETDAWYGITFHNSSWAPNGVSLIPTQLLSSAGDFVICVILLAYAKRRPKTGCIAAMYMIVYGIGRFLIEFLRNDYRGSVGFLSTSQFISIGIVAGGIVLYLVRSKMSKDFEE